MSTRIQISNPKVALTAGEQALVEFLDAHLPAEWRIFAQPYLNGLRPDVVAFHPRVGVMIYEVKDWDLSHYGVREGRFGVRDAQGRFHAKKTPLAQASHYRAAILELLLAKAGEAVEQDSRAFGMIKVGTYFHGATQAEVEACFGSCAPHSPQIGRDSLRAEKLGFVMPDAERSQSRYWRPEWNDRLLFWLLPPYQSIEQAMPLVLSEEQRRHAEPRPGHHRLRGVVGSGKTQVIAHRAARLASEGRRVLVLCFNITLRNYLEDLIKRAPYSFCWDRIQITHFHGLCADLLNEAGMEWPKQGGDLEAHFRVEVPRATEEAISLLRPEPYDAILIDEGQDFYPEWYHLLTRLLSERNELLLVCDKKQNIYRRELNWVEGSMKGMGTRFRGAWGELTTIYRLSEAIAALADRFAVTFALNQDLRPRKVQPPQLSDRAFRPECHWLDLDAAEWLDAVWLCASELFQAQESPSDIAILLPDHAHGMQAVAAFEERAIRVNHVFAPDRERARPRKCGFYMGDGRLKMSTVHSYKGWESLDVILYIPEQHADPEALDAIVYTAMTRARQKLFVLNACSRYQAFSQTPVTAVRAT